MFGQRTALVYTADSLSVDRYDMQVVPLIQPRVQAVPLTLNQQFSRIAGYTTNSTQPEQKCTKIPKGNSTYSEKLISLEDDKTIRCDHEKMARDLVIGRYLTKSNDSGTFQDVKFAGSQTPSSVGY
ncbi:hypothetical protein AVEN_21936-1 [Araneus ventricosus]|uniref:Uncharacterized protein n=1 Tax=Araneus ventricosus TaxID=182803 RepID=A0A4Y2D3D2_ARAVE|nr:hypothetical protein AVEN_21936-1 [Araneus ventricosus]